LDEVAAARRDLERALDELDAAAHRARSAIGTASDYFNDSWWDHVKGVVRDVADQIVVVIDVLEKVAIVIALVALVVAIVCTGGAAAALVGALFWAGVGVSLTTAALRTALVISDSGKATWGDVIWDLANVGLCALGGRAMTLGKLASETVDSVAVQSREIVIDLARDGLTQNAKNALRMKSVANPLKAWALRQVRAAARPGLEEVERAATLRASIRQALLRLSREDAETVMRLRALRELNLRGTEKPLDEALRKVAVAYRMNVANLTGTADAVLDQVDLNPSQVVKRGIDDAIARRPLSSWRLSAAGR
jgi:hypothetical protein